MIMRLEQLSSCPKRRHHPWMNRVALAAVVLWIGFAFPGTGRTADMDSLPVEATLPELLAYGETHNPAIIATDHDFLAAREAVTEQSAWPDPVFSYAYFVEEVETRVGPQEHIIGLRQRLPWPGTLSLKAKSARNRAEAAGETVRRERLEVIRTIKTAYFETVYLDRARVLTREHLARLDSLEPVVRNEYVTGRAGQNALLQLQIARERLANRMDQLKRRSIPVMDRLKTALNLPLKAPLSLRLSPAVFKEFDDVKAREWLRASHPDLKFLQSVAAAAEDRVQLADRNRYPSLTLGMNYMVTGDARMNGVDDSGKDPFNVSLSVSIPVSGRTGAAVRRTRLEAAAAQQRIHASENKLDAALSEVLYKYRDARDTLRLYTESLIPLAEQSLEVTLQDFQAGNGRFSEVIEAQRDLLDLSLVEASCRFDAARYLAEIETHTARTLLEAGYPDRFETVSEDSSGKGTP